MKTQNENNGTQTSGINKTSWQTENMMEISSLTTNKITDVVIVGAGIAGLMTAYQLLKSGRKVIVVEDGQPGSGETGRTSAHLTAMLDRNYTEYIDKFGEENARLIAQSHMIGIDEIERISLAENIDCDFLRTDGYLFVHPSDSETSLDEEYNAAKNVGLDVELVSKAPGMNKEIRSLKFKDQAQFHPLKFINGLVKAILSLGGEIYGNTHAKKIDHTGIATAEGLRVDAEHVVVATNAPVNNRLVMVFKHVPFRTFVIGLLVRKDEIPFALFNDTGDYYRNKDFPPYHYVRLQKYDDENDLLLCGGEDHETGNPQKTEPPMTEAERYDLLEDWAREHFNAGQVVYRWSGQVMQAVDGIGYVGRNPFDRKNVYIITGDSGDGLTNASLGSLLLADLINEKENPWEDLYKPSRNGLRGTISGALQIAGSMFTPEPQTGDLSSLDTLEPGQGKLIEIDNEKCGAYRNEDGSLTLVSAKCTHVGCTITWNGDEKTWDCPCHGSRFSPAGVVINGPANSNLPSINEKK